MDPIHSAFARVIRANNLNLRLETVRVSPRVYRYSVFDGKVPIRLEMTAAETEAWLQGVQFGFERAKK